MAASPQRDQPEAADAAADRAQPRRDAPQKSHALTAVRYGAMQWVGEFSYKRGTLDGCGIPVVIQTDRGIELGHTIQFCCEDSPVTVPWEQLRRYVQNSGPEFCRPRSGRILRQATPQDIDEHRRLNAHSKDDIDQCAALASQLNLDMRVVTAEHLLGGERIVFYFRSEGRIDFRELVRELAQRYRTRIEMRQVGARDEARLVADWEVCGRECCCKNFLKKLRPVNMKMAKLQKSTLDPSKVSGRCGRLRCCLRYEHEGYVELANRLPKRGTRVATAHGEGVVVDYQVLTQLVLVRPENQNQFAVPFEEIAAFDLPAPTEQPYQAKAPPPRAAEPEKAAPEETRHKPRHRRRPRRGPDATPEDKPASTAEPAGGSDGPQAPAPPPAPPTDARSTDQSAPNSGTGSPGASGKRRRRRRRKAKPDARSGGRES